MPKGRHIIHYKQKRAAHWAVRFLRLCDFVTTISTARRNFSFLWATLYAPNNPIHSRESLLSLWDGWDRASG